MSKLQIIVATTRPTRSADRVVPWVVNRAESHGAFAVEVIDLRDWALPMFQEHFGTLGDLADPTYSEPIVKEWNSKIKEGDAYLFITGEYNHSIPAVLKNAIDCVYVSFAFRNKPASFVGYSGAVSAGVRAVEHLAAISIEAELVPLRNSVLIPHVVNAFNEDHEPLDGQTETALEILLDDLAWWSRALAQARAQGELPPGISRAREAAAKRAQLLAVSEEA